MALIAQEVSLETIRSLRPLVQQIARRDKSLATQIRRAASSITLNIGEADYSDPGNARARYHTAAGSAGETRVALLTAIAWGLVREADCNKSLKQLDRILGLLWGLTRR